jgi:hypothetical protein
MLQAAAGVFQTYVQAALEAAAAEAFVDDEGEDKTGSASAHKRDEQLAAVSACHWPDGGEYSDGGTVIGWVVVDILIERLCLVGWWWIF